MKLITILTASLILPLSPAIAQGKPVPEPTQDTRIEADSEANEIRFIIDGEVVGVLTSDGLRVSGDVTAVSFLHGAKSVADTKDGETGETE